MAHRESLVRGAAVLVAAGLIIRVTGLVYQIPLAHWLGGEGLGIYRMALPAFWAFYRVAVGGIPTALSNLVSEYTSRGRPRAAEDAFRLAMGWTMAVAAAAMGLAAPWVARLVGEPRTALVLVVLAPALWLFAVQQVYGGYLQGRQIMTPWAAANLLEQAGRIAGALAGAWYLRRYGLAWGAAGAALGATAAGLVTNGYLVSVHARVREGDRTAGPGQVRPRPDPGEPAARLAWRLFRLAWPVTLGGAVLPLLHFADTAVVQRGLVRLGLTTAQATELYGQFHGMAYTLVTVPNVFALGLAAALMPAVTRSHARGDGEGVREKCELALRATALIGLPCALALAVLAEPLMAAMFRAGHAAPLLVWAAPIAFFSPLMMVLAGALQGLGHTAPPTRNLVLTMAAKVAADAWLAGRLGILAVVASSVLSYAAAAWLNLRELGRVLDWQVDWRRVFWLPLAAAAGTAAALALLAYGWRLPNPWGTLALAALLAPPIYALLLGLTGALTGADLRELAGPAARRLDRLLHWWPF